MISFLSTWQICVTPVFLGAEIVKTLLMHLFVRATARLVALRIAVVWRIAFVDTTAAEKGNYTWTISLGTRQQKEQLLFSVKRHKRSLVY